MPYPPDTGGKQDTFFLLREFSRLGHEVTAGIVYHGDDPDKAPEEFAGLVKEMVFLPGNPKPLHSRLLSSLSDDVPFKFRKYHSEQALRDVVDCVSGEGAFDIILSDHFHLAPLALDARSVVEREGGRVPLLVLRTPNVESTIVQKYAERVDNPLLKAFANREARKMKRYEARSIDMFDLVAAISPIDRDVLREISAHPETIICVTAGADVDRLLPPEKPPKPGEVVFVGSFDWQPNADGAMWLVEKVWPKVIGEFSGAHLSLVGKNPPPYLEKAAGPGITLTGRVDSVEEYVARAACCVVPLWIGSGMRFKILEAFALARAVVSTSLGAEGIEAEDGKHILIRDDPDEFADAVIGLLRSPERREELGRNARALVERKYSWKQVARGFSDAIETLVVSRAGA